MDSNPAKSNISHSRQKPTKGVLTKGEFGAARVVAIWQGRHPTVPFGHRAGQ